MPVFFENSTRICETCREPYDMNTKFGSGKRYCSSKCRPSSKLLHKAAPTFPRQSAEQRDMVVDWLLKTVPQGTTVLDAVTNDSITTATIRFICHFQLFDRDIKLCIRGREADIRWAHVVGIWPLRHGKPIASPLFAPACRKFTRTEHIVLKLMSNYRKRPAPCFLSTCTKCSSFVLFSKILNVASAAPTTREKPLDSSLEIP